MSRAPTESNITQCEGARAILEAAERLFSDKGFDGTSINAVAEAAGVSKANVFHHFSTKEALYLAVLRRATDETHEALKEVTNGEGSLETRLRRFVKSQLALMLRHQRANRLVLREVLEHGEERGEYLVQEVFGNKHSELTEILREGQTQGLLREDFDPAVLTTLLVGANVFFFQVNSVLRHYPEVDFADDPERFSDAVADILLRGVQTPSHPTGH